jgi:hypothetical protein
LCISRLVLAPKFAPGQVKDDPDHGFRVCVNALINKCLKPYASTTATEALFWCMAGRSHVGRARYTACWPAATSIGLVRLTGICRQTTSVATRVRASVLGSCWGHRLRAMVSVSMSQSRYCRGLWVKDRVREEGLN